MSYQVKFSSKDHLLTDFYERYWSVRFQVELDEYGASLDDADTQELIDHWKLLMAEDARRQEHYDYIIVDGRRQPVLGDRGKKLLLVPDLEIVLT